MVLVDLREEFSGVLVKQKTKQTRRARAATENKKRAAKRAASGRVHLRLVRDPASNREAVVLTRPAFEEAWQNEVALGAANTAHDSLAGHLSVDRVVELARNAMAATSRLAEGLLARAPQGAVACRAGCDHCCYQSVGVTPPEALAIVDHLRQTLSGEELVQLASHIDEAHEKTAGLSADARFSPEYPCPFLDRGQCSIYEVRPLSCRGMNSLNAEECATRLREPDARAEFLESGVGGHTYMEPIRGFHAISAGLQLALWELFHLDMRPLELTAAVRLLLEDTGTLPEKWLRGERAFETARGGDSTNQQGARELSGALGDSSK